MSKKSCLRGPIDRQHGKRAETLTDSISTAAPLPCSLITVKVIECKRVTLSDMEILNTFCQRIGCG